MAKFNLSKTVRLPSLDGRDKRVGELQGENWSAPKSQVPGPKTASTLNAQRLTLGAQRLTPKSQVPRPKALLRSTLYALPFALTTLASAQSTSVAANVTPGGSLTKSMGIDQHFGTQIPLSATFKDETGRTVTMRDELGARPVMILPMFFGCNGVCRLEVEDIFKTLEKDKKITPGKDFDLILLSINPTETPQMASDKKQQILAAYHVPGGDVGVHGLTGSYDQIRAVTDALGFRYSYNPTTHLINHPAGMMFLDKEGVIRGYMYGAEYPTEVIEKNLQAAAKEVEGVKPEVILLGCVMIDPVTHKRTFVIENIMKVIGSATALLVFGSILYMTKKYKLPPAPGQSTGGQITGV